MSGYTGYQGAKPDSREELAKRLRAQILGQALPQTIGGGLGMLGAGLAAGFAKRNAVFPTAPGGGQPQQPAPPLPPPVEIGAPAVPPQLVAQTQMQPPPPQQAPQGGSSEELLYQILTHPFSTPEDKAVANMMLQQRMQQQQQSAREQQMWMERQRYEHEAKRNGPAYELGLEKSRLELEDAKKPKREPLINAGNGNVYDLNTGDWIAPPRSDAPEGAFRFSGNSVEAQALNGLIDSRQLTPEQAQQLAARKTISGPNGELIFLTPQGVFGAPSQGGGVVQPIMPNGGQQGPQGGSQAAPQPSTAPLSPGQSVRGGNIQLTQPRVADNMADIADVGGFDPTMITAFATGGIKGAAIQALTRSANAIAGRNTQTRDLIAQALMETAPTRANERLLQAVRRFGSPVRRRRPIRTFRFTKRPPAKPTSSMSTGPATTRGYASITMSRPAETRPSP
ncbi:hypothetical protein [Sinorhizobium arboris]|uniref:hypothetical protein n=1 Tax=Sinorhizobium arboris TaxID=76745 RepID=UPI00040E4902|nr:hypothetical protein [Sinorhizobium arboris]